MAWSPPAHKRRIVWVSAPGDYATFNSNQNSGRHPRQTAWACHWRSDEWFAGGLCLVKISATRAGHALFGRRIAGDALAGTLALFCLANSLLMVNFQVSRLFLLDEAGYGDSYILYDALHFKATGVIYRDLSQPPYLPAQYSPLLYMLYSFPGQIGTFPNPLVGPRLIALAAFLSCVAVVISIVRTPVPARYAWLWGLLLATSTISMREWVFQLRGDFPGIFFSLLALRLLLARCHNATLLAGLSAGFAMQFKITFVSALTAGFLWLLFRKSATGSNVGESERRRLRGRRKARSAAANIRPSVDGTPLYQMTAWFQVRNGSWRFNISRKIEKSIPKK